MECENGFRAGYLNQLEALICKQFPNTDIRADPHINSKFHVWKKYYSTLVGMMGKSDFGWDDSRSMITVDPQEVWDEYCKVDHTARTMHYKSWLFFPAWRGIFGRDKAEGNDKAISDEIQVTQDPNIQSATSHRKSGSTSKKRKGLKVADDDGLSNVVSTFCEGVDARLGEISKKLFVDFFEVEKRTAVFDAVEKVPEIDMNDQILVSDRLVDNPKKIDLFFSLPEEARARMVGLAKRQDVITDIEDDIISSGFF
ncbi:UNVERIFIED_CONTAM: hypothetical protein Slati_1411300 [Sesamum latifolium]|uniref:Myb/SANT-like domain-containing protein n=1 Tax=Sesamum latifolium TaxID=2727402 RepID=A0AAW2X353_9LAMI